MEQQNNESQDLDVLVVGAGFAGLYQLERLRSLGFNTKVVEAGAEVGGIWYWNCYPGARVDTEGAIYQFSREDLWRDWSYNERYPDWRGVRDYFRYVDQKLDLSRDIHFNTRVETAVFDEEARQWVVSTSDGKTLRTRFLVPCTGFGSKPYFPNIQGLDRFKGECHHTGLWPQEGLDLSGMRVAVIGTGASGVQVIQEAARYAAQLTVFQRTPNTALPMRQQKLDEAAQAALKEEQAARFKRRTEVFAGFDFDFIPKDATAVSDEERRQTYEELWEQGGFRPWVGTFQDVLFDERANRTEYDFWREKTLERIDDPAVGAILAPEEPPHPFGVKRPSLEQNFYEVFNQDNVTLVDLRATPILEVTETGIRTTEGEFEFDVLVLATGFDAVTGGLTSIDIRGTNGESLAEKWSNSVAAHLGVATAGFPNMLFVYGPQSPSGFCNGPTCAEAQGEVIVNLLETLRDRDITRLEAKAEADDAWRQACMDGVAPSLFPLADSWYMGANVPGKPREMLMYPSGVPSYFQEWADAAASGYPGFQQA